jgi:hypothetical protein
MAATIINCDGVVCHRQLPLLSSLFLLQTTNNDGRTGITSGRRISSLCAVWFCRVFHEKVFHETNGDLLYP